MSHRLGRRRIIAGLAASLIGGVPVARRTLGAPAVVPGSDLPGWRLAFYDEFDGPRLDRARWKTTLPWDGLSAHTLAPNGERQYYIADRHDLDLGIDPFRLGAGVLAIEGKPTPNLPRSAAGPLLYTSGIITSERSFGQTYGLWRMRARLPPGKGLWPGFWMGATARHWPPELDPLEAFGASNGRGEGGPTWYHFGAIGASGAWTDVGVDLYSDFHVYEVEWRPETCVFRFDGREVGHTATPKTAHEDMFCLANLAIGGNWPGLPDAANRWPARLLIDWIRVYRQAA